MPQSRPKKRVEGPANKAKLSDLYLQKLRRTKHAKPFLVWDTEERGLALSVRPNGHTAFKYIYSFRGRARWYSIGDIGLAEARKRAMRLKVAVADGKDPQAERRAERGHGTFAELHARYLVECAQKENKSWKQANTLVQKHLLPKWGKLQARDVTRADVKAMMGRIKAPITANQVLASASAIFTWGVKQELVTDNPCKLVDRNPTKSRERVLIDSELSLFCKAFDNTDVLQGTALKLILLTGQRPGEVSHMRREHIKDGWWTMPGKPAKGWPGTKNAQTHRVWLPEPARQLLKLFEDDKDTGYVLAGGRGGPVDDLDATMRKICADLKVEKATPHDLRRTHGTTVTGLGFGREAMNRIQNHREGGIADVYDQHSYAKENQKIMEAVAKRIMDLVEGRADSNVIPAVFGGHKK